MYNSPINMIEFTDGGSLVYRSRASGELLEVFTRRLEVCFWDDGGNSGAFSWLSV